MTALCDLCKRPDPTGGYVCDRCASYASTDLHDIAEMTPAARAVAAGLTRSGPAVGGTGVIWLQLNLHAQARLDRVQNELTTLARHVSETRGEPVTGPIHDPLVLAATWLADCVEWLRHRQEAAEQFALIAACRRALAGVVDPPAERRWLGQCGAQTMDGPCQADLYARIGSEHVTCRACQARHDVEQRQAQLDWQVRSYSYTSGEIEAAYGIKAATIRKWVQRGRIHPSGEVDGKPVYPLGEVLALAERDAARRVRGVT